MDLYLNYIQILHSNLYNLRYLNSVKSKIISAHSKECDFIITPTAPSAAFPLNEEQKDPIKMYLNDVFTVPASLAGLPGISIPAGVDKKGYPLGLQIIGKAFDEQTILNIAYSMEEKINFKNKITDWWIK